MELTEKIKAQVKAKTSDRYKLAVQVHIGAMEVRRPVPLQPLTDQTTCAPGSRLCRLSGEPTDDWLQGQGIFSASRCLWDEKTDNYVSASYYNNSLFAVATVFACYYE